MGPRNWDRVQADRVQADESEEISLSQDRVQADDDVTRVGVCLLGGRLPEWSFDTHVCSSFRKVSSACWCGANQSRSRCAKSGAIDG